MNLVHISHIVRFHRSPVGFAHTLANISAAHPAPAVNVVHFSCIVCVYRSPDSFVRSFAIESAVQPAPVVNVVHISGRIGCGGIQWVAVR